MSELKTMPSKYITNCPNCGAVLKGYGRCEYCGTVIDQPVRLLAIRPGMKKLVAQDAVPIFIGEQDAEVATKYAIRQIRDQMVDGITEAIKFTVKKDFDPRRMEEIVCVRGELWIAEPDANI